MEPNTSTNKLENRHGPLAGLKVVELGGIGPGPHGAMLLGDLGADVVRVVPAGVHSLDPDDVTYRNRRLVRADLKVDSERGAVLDLVQHADVVIEGFRPGVAERLGVGPEICLGRNPRLTYAQMTGWGQDGPLSQSPGHDINFLALSGALHHMGRPGIPPSPPLNLVADYGGGSMMLVFGVLASCWETARSGKGQVIDVSMFDGVNVLMQYFWGLRAAGRWTDLPGSNMFDGGAPFYRTYECSDHRWLAVGAVEVRFYTEFVRTLGLDESTLPAREDPANWPTLCETFAAIISQRGLDAWARKFDNVEACVSPVLTLGETGTQAHVLARRGFVNVRGVLQAAPAPRFSRTPAPQPRARPDVTEQATDVLQSWATTALRRSSERS